MIARCFLCMVIPAGLLAVYPQQQPDVPVFRATTNLVQVSVVVTDKDGRSVPGLKQSDFTVLENGKAQSILVFVDEKQVPRSQRPAIELPRGIFTNRPEFLGAPARNATAILLDSVNSKWDDLAVARFALSRYLTTLPPDTRVGLYILGQRLHILQDFTSDVNSLRRMLVSQQAAALPPSASLEQLLRIDQDSWTRAMSEVGLAADEVSASFQLRSKVPSTLQALEVIARHMASMPGRKTLVWISSGFPVRSLLDFSLFERTALSRNPLAPPNLALGSMMSFDFSRPVERTIRALNQIGVAIYPVDPRGLQNIAFVDASISSAGLPLPPSISRETIGSMVELANRTGGLATYNTNDLSLGLERALSDSDQSYTIGYNSRNSNPDGKYRTIRVSVARPGLRVRHRTGYFAAPPADERQQVREADITRLVTLPMDATSIPLTARVDLIERPSISEANVLLQIEPDAIVFERDRDKWTTRLSIVFFQAGVREGEWDHKHPDIRLTDAEMEKVRKQGLIYRYRLPLRNDAHFLRIGVLDAVTGSAGTLAVHLAKVPRTRVD